MARADLNAKRAARSEAENEPHELVLGYDDEGNEQVFLLRPRMPMEFPPLLRAARFDEAMQVILVNPADWERLRAAVPEDDDWADISALYGTDQGESSASTPSSTNDGRKSRQTSHGTTPGSRNSQPAVTAPTPSGSDGSPS